GKNILKIDSPGVYPHLDKFALVYKPEGQWPFGTPPYAISLIGSVNSLALPPEADPATFSQPYLERFAAFFDQLRTGKISNQSLFRSWVELEKFDQQFAAWFSENGENVRTDYPRLLSFWLQTGDAQNIDPLVKARLLEARPENEFACAKTLQQLVLSRTDTGPATRELVNQLNLPENPASVPIKSLDEFLTPDQQKTYSRSHSVVRNLEQSQPRPPVAMGVTEAKAENLRVHLRGSHLALGETVPRRFLRIIDGESGHEIANDRSGRLELADWITGPDHPLTSRVIVNRIWHWHFGRGIVGSVDNFGLLGESPSHPQLLDWLAVELMENQWSLKSLHRQILLSRTYRMANRGTPRAEERDPENLLRWRFDRRRLTAEETRDAILQVTTGLDQRMFGTLLKAKNRQYVTSSSTTITDEYRNRRRSVYLPVIRSSVYDVLQTLDFPDPAVSAGKRQTSTIAPQALMMMNSDLVTRSVEYAADWLVARDGNRSQKIQLAYRRILARNPSPTEVERMESFVYRGQKTLSEEPDAGTVPKKELDRKIWQSVCRILMSTNEFHFVE
ncbi:MAG: DUF1553 domain-containing protein, partial [Planctomycetota bacterium]|nr:DUF1553 domain-containing protein [Planctomycetota bacterium]